MKINNMLEKSGNAQNEKKEVAEMLNVFSKEASKPSEKFMASLQKEYISALHDQHDSKLLSGTQMHRNTKLLFSSFAVILLLAAGFIGTTQFVLPAIEAEKARQELATLNQPEILAQIAKNNTNNTNSSNALLNNNKSARDFAVAELGSGSNAGVVSDAQADIAIAPSIGMLYPNVPQNDQYVKTTSTTTAGPAYASCPAGVIDSYDPKDPASKLKSVSETYASKDGKYFNRMKYYDKNDQLYFYSLQGDKFSVDYAGGEYAIRREVANDIRIMEDSAVGAPSATNTTNAAETVTVRDAVATTPASDVTTKSPTIQDFLGPDAKIIKVEKIDGKEYYVVTWSTQGYCTWDERAYYYGDVAVSSADNSTKLYNKGWFAKDDYAVKKSEVYRASDYAASALISAYTVETEAKTMNLADAQALFSFEFNVPLKAYQSPVSKTNNELVSDYLKSHSVSTLWLTGYNLGYFSVKYNYSTTDSFALYSARSYFPAGARGDKMYESAETSRKQSELYYKTIEEKSAELNANLTPTSAVSSTTDIINISVYKSTVADSIILNNYAPVSSYSDKGVADYQKPTTTDSFLTIDGVKVPAKLHMFVQTSGSSSGSTGNGSSSVDPSGPDYPQTVKPEDNMRTQSYTTYVATFTYDGYKYAIASGQTKTDSLGKFTTLKSSVTTQLQQILDRVKQAEQNVKPIPADDAPAKVERD